MKRFPIYVIATLAAWGSHVAIADEISLVAPGGIRAALVQMFPEFERRTGHTVVATFGSGGATKDRVVRGEPFDVPIVEPPYDGVLASGNVVAASETPLATVSVGVAVRAGAAKPDIGTVEAVKRLLLEARSIAVPDAARGAAAGVTFNATLEKLGILEAVKPKLQIATSGSAAMAMLAKGEVDIGVTFVSEILPEPGAEAVGALPRDISPPTAFVAFVSSHARSAEAARALIDFLASPEAGAVFRARGMEPGR